VCSSVHVYALGSEAELELAVAVENRGEDAFEAVVRIFTPADVDYIRVGDIAAPVSSQHFPNFWRGEGVTYIELQIKSHITPFQSLCAVAQQQGVQGVQCT